MKFQGIRINLLSLEPLYQPPNPKKLLEALCSRRNLQPTHWGGDPPTTPFAMEALLQKMDSPYSETVFQRDEDPHWWGLCVLNDRWFQRLFLEFEGSHTTEVRRAVFDWCDQVAEVVKPVLGVVHLNYPDEPRFRGLAASSALDERAFEMCGPGPLCARNYLGQHLRDMLGMDVISGIAGPELESYPWGVRIDLVENVWDADLLTIYERQKAVLKILKPLDIIADYSKFANPRCAKKWKSPDKSTLIPHGSPKR